MSKCEFRYFGRLTTGSTKSQNEKEVTKMKGTKFFRTGIALAVCVLVLLLAGETCFVAWAKGKPPKTTEHYGYVELKDNANDKIWSDLGIQYGDYHIAGWEDYVKLTTENSSGDLVRSDFKCGWPPSSTRRVFMDISGSTQVASPNSTEETFLDILLSQEESLSNPPPIAHLQGRVNIGGTIQLEYVDFIVDTITRGVLWNPPYNFSDDELQKYRFSSYTGLADEDQHLCYGLDYPGSTTVTEVVESTTWKIEPSGSPVELFVYKKKGKGGGYKAEVLATYNSLPFGWTTSLESIPAAPRKHNTLSATWGKIKAK
jgi:hypothetical protein